ncbi:hypothetical protein F4679DRAFT_540229 [Xylaria curta]|nr:hypothetical protein F4679DRAFT_540229 [Xylaria curta]
MPFPPSTRRISPREWEENKSRIVELFITSRRTLEGPDGVIEMMRKEGFDATVSQYEHQFRKWGVRKNKRQTKQVGVIDETYQGGDVVEGNDQAMPRGTRRRAWRRLASGTNQGEEPVPPSFEVTAQADGRDVSELDPERADLDAEADLVAITIAPNAGVDSITSNQSIHPSIWIPDDWNAVDSDTFMADSLNFLLPLQDLSDPPWNRLNFSPAEISSAQQSNNAVQSIGQSPTNDLPYARATPSVVLSSRRLWLRPLPSAELIDTFIKCIYIESPTASTSTNAMDSELAFKFLNAVTESNPSSRYSRALQVYHSLTSSDTFAGEEWSQLAELSYGKSLEARFDSRLLASVINSFPGLGNIPAAGVLNFLNRHPALQRIVLDFFNAPSSPLTKSFTEKIFLAYTEVDNVEVVKFLLNSRLHDADNAVCYRDGKRYTPLEYAAIKQAFKVLQLLISRKVNVNKSYSKDRRSNALLLLVQGVKNHRVTLSHDFLYSAHALLKAQATILIDTIREALWLTDSRFASQILRLFASQNPERIILHKNLLTEIVDNLDKQNATEIIQFIVNKCQELGKPRQLNQFSLHFDKALEMAVKRGYDELAEVLSPYVSSPTTILQTARMKGNQAVVELILQKYPGLIDDTEVSHTFISALTSGNENLLRRLDNTGALDRLQGDKLGQALAAALRAGNLEYATKLLELDPELTFYANRKYGLADDERFDISLALRDALTHNFDDIAWDLLAIGLTTKAPSWENQHRSPPLLYVAVEKERPEFVKAIIEFGFDPSILEGGVGDEWPIFETAIQCANSSIFDDVWKARPCPIYPSDRLYELALEKGHRDLFFDIVKSSPQDHDFWKVMALKVAVKREDKSLLDELFSFGVPAYETDILNMAVEDHPSMVKPLLDRFWKAHPQDRSRYGARFVWRALNCYSESPEYLEMVFDLNLVTMNVGDQACSWTEAILIKAIETRDCQVVQRFINAGCNVNGIFKDDHSNINYAKTNALLAAIDTGLPEMVRLLIDHDANVNELAQFGLLRTPLQKAAEINNISIVRLLLENGADVNAAPAKFVGATALQLAAIHGNCEMATILIEYGARQDIPPPTGPRGRYPLEGAAENGRFDMLELLWIAPRGPYDDKQCQKAMRLAERNGHIGCKEKIEELMAQRITPWTPTLQN